MKREDFEVGQTVYLFRILNYTRGETLEDRIREAKVLSVGRKYITVDFCRSMKFDIANDFREVTDYSPSFKLYASKEQIFQEYQRKQMENDVCAAFVWPNDVGKEMSDEDLQAGFDIISKYKRTK